MVVQSALKRLLLICVVFFTGAIASVSGQSVSISGNQILINGVPGTLKGFTFIGRLTPTSCGSQTDVTAWNNWSAAELKAARDAFHTNTVRMQVSLSYLDPQSPVYSPTYVQQIDDSVALARSLGMIAVVSMQWQSWNVICNAPQINGQPDAATDRAWAALLSSNDWTSNSTYTSTPVNFNHDGGVVLEVFNEPGLGGACGTAAEWSTWQSNLQLRVNNIRAVGFTGSLIIPGLYQDHLLDGTYFGGLSVASYLLTDPQSSTSPQLIYAMHPYPASHGTTCTVGGFSAMDWNRWFGNVAKTLSAPVVVSEWFTGGAFGKLCFDPSHQPSPPLPPGYSSPTNFFTPTMAQDFVNWLATAGPNNSTMSLLGAWPFDEAGYIIQDFTSYAPTFFDANFACGVKVQGANGQTYEGPGAVLQSFFAVH
jgi:hypothetical protein